MSRKGCKRDRGSQQRWQGHKAYLCAGVSCYTISSSQVYKPRGSSRLESMHMYQENGVFTEADLIIKLYRPILENLFCGSGFKLTWYVLFLPTQNYCMYQWLMVNLVDRSDTISSFSDTGSKLDLRVMHAARHDGERIRKDSKRIQV